MSFLNSEQNEEKTTSIFKVFISTIKCFQPERFEVQHKHAINSQNIPYLH